MNDSEPPPSRDRLSDFLLGGAFFSCVWMLAICVAGIAGYRALSAAPPEPALVFRGADGETMTVEDLADGIKPYSHRYIDAELPWGTRWIAHKICDWSVRSHIKIAIAVHGPKVAGALRVVEPLSNNLFKPEPAARIRGLRKLCEQDVQEFGAIAVEARADAGPVGDIGR